MREKYNSSLSTTAETNKIGRFGRFLTHQQNTNIGPIYQPGRYIGLSLIKTCQNNNHYPTFIDMTELTSFSSVI